MFSKARPTKTVSENRGAKREPMLGVTALVRSASGIVLEGVVQDVSDGGIGISGDTTGLHSGEKVEVLLVIQGERVGYFGAIRHMDMRGRFYGVHFESGPFRGDQKSQAVKQCKQCRRDYPDDHKFCFRCGQRLIGGHRTAPQDGPPPKSLGASAS